MKYQLLDIPHLSSESELVLALLLAFFTDRIVEVVWETNVWKKIREATGLHRFDTKPKGDDEDDDIQQSFLYALFHSVTLAARGFLFLRFVEGFLNRFPTMRTVSVFTDSPLSLKEVAPSIAVTTWTALTMSTVKRIFLLQSVKGKSLGRVALFDKLINFVIFLLTVLNIMDSLDLNLSLGIQSILSAGGVSALVFSLASKDLAEQIVGGFSLGAWEAINQGEIVRLSDGTEGVVLQIGLVETLIRGWDNIVVRIPNSHLTSARMMNLSRVKHSRLRQLLRFKYSDMDKIPSVLAEIKEQVKVSCPKLVTTKSFHSVLLSYEADHVCCLAQAHFDIQYATAEFVNNRQEFLLAIARAVKKHDVSFALPSVAHYDMKQHNVNGMDVPMRSSVS